MPETRLSKAAKTPTQRQVRHDICRPPHCIVPNIHLPPPLSNFLIQLLKQNLRISDIELARVAKCLFSKGLQDDPPPKSMLILVHHSKNARRLRRGVQRQMEVRLDDVCVSRPVYDAGRGPRVER